MAQFGGVPKAFFACGEKAEKTLEQFAASWHFGFFSTGRLQAGVAPPLLSQLTDCGLPPVNGLVIDIADKALTLALQSLENITLPIDVLILLEDENRQTTAEEEGLIEELLLCSKANLVHRGQCEPENALLSLYANFLCGPDLVCTDLADFKSALFGAKRFIKLEYTTSDTDNISAISQALIAQLKGYDIELSKFSGAVISLAGNIALITVEFFALCSESIEAELPDHTVVCVYSNMQSPKLASDITVSMLIALGE